MKTLKHELELNLVFFSRGIRTFVKHVRETGEFFAINNAK